MRIIFKQILIRFTYPRRTRVLYTIILYKSGTIHFPVLSDCTGFFPADICYSIVFGWPSEPFVYQCNLWLHITTWIGGDRITVSHATSLTRQFKRYIYLRNGSENIFYYARAVWRANEIRTTNNMCLEHVIRKRFCMTFSPVLSNSQSSGANLPSGNV